MARLFTLTLAALFLAAPALAADRGYDQDTDGNVGAARDDNGDGGVNSWEYQDGFGQKDTLDNFSTYDEDGDGMITDHEGAR